MRKFEVFKFLDKQIFRMLPDAYSEAGRLPVFRNIVELCHKKTGLTLKQFKILLEGDIDYTGKTIDSFVKIARLLEIIDIKTKRVLSRSNQIAIIALNSPPLEKRKESLHIEEKLYFLPRILYFDANSLLTYLSLANENMDIKAEFANRLSKTIKLLQELYENTVMPYRTYIKKKLINLEHRLTESSQSKKPIVDPKLRKKFQQIRYSQRFVDKMVPERKEGPPEYRHRIDMLRQWSDFLSLTKNGKLTENGKRLIEQPLLIHRKVDGQEIISLPLEKQILKEVFKKMPEIFTNEFLIKNEALDVYFLLASRTYGLDYKQTNYSNDEIFRKIGEIYDQLVIGRFRQVNLEAIKEALDIMMLSQEGKLTSDFIDFIRWIERNKASEVSISTSALGLGYITWKGPRKK